MNDHDLFNYRRLPARLTPEQVALLLNFEVYQIAILVRLGLLHPLGKPAANGHKFFCCSEIVELSQSREFLDKATRAVAKHVREKARKYAKQAGKSSSLTAVPSVPTLATP